MQNSEAVIFLVFETNGIPARKYACHKVWLRNLSWKLSFPALQIFKGSKCYALRGKWKFSMFFTMNEVKQHRSTQKPRPPVVQALVRDGGHWGSSCCFPHWGPKADVWALQWRWMPALPANDTKIMIFHCLLVGLTIFLHNSVITGYRLCLRRPVVMAPDWDIGAPDLVVPNEAENGFEQEFPMSKMSDLTISLFAGLFGLVRNPLSFTWSSFLRVLLRVMCFWE